MKVCRLTTVLVLVSILGGFFPSDSSPREFYLDLPNATGKSTDESENLPELITFYGSEYEANAVIFCLDESLSMRQNNRWDLQKREAVRAISELEEGTEFGVIFYGAGAYPFRSRLVPANTANKQAAVAWVLNRAMSLGTCLGPGVIQSLDMLRRSESSHRTVIVAGDGRPTVCPFVRGQGRNETFIRQLLEETVAANPGRQIRVHTILVGQNPGANDVTFMQRLASAHNGTFKTVSR